MKDNSTIYFDMDGTLFNLYGVEGWLDKIQNSEVQPFEVAQAMVDVDIFQKEILRLKEFGYKVGIISWLSLSGTDSYNTRIRQTKLARLNETFPLINWDEISIINYGVPKHCACAEPNGILFDDNVKIRESWSGIAFSEKCIIDILKLL